MLEQDYKAVSKIIEEIVGEDTVQGVKLLEGIKHYFDNRYSKTGKINEILRESEEAMNRFSEKTLKESQNYRKLRKAFQNIENN